MSTPQAAARETGTSSIHLERTASGKTVVAVKCYSETNDPFDVAQAEARTVEIFERLCERYPTGSAS